MIKFSLILENSEQKNYSELSSYKRCVFQHSYFCLVSVAMLFWIEKTIELKKIRMMNVIRRVSMDIEITLTIWQVKLINTQFGGASYVPKFINLEC